MMSEVSKSVREKAQRLVEEGKVRKDMDSDRRTYFIVKGETDTHSIIFDKISKEWSCDCRYNSTKGLECSHIYACKMIIKG